MGLVVIFSFGVEYDEKPGHRVVGKRAMLVYLLISSCVQLAIRGRGMHMGLAWRLYHRGFPAEWSDECVANDFRDCTGLEYPGVESFSKREWVIHWI